MQVTEQPQMKKYSTLQDEVNDIAKMSGATTTFQTVGGTSYLKTDPSASDQVVFAPVNGLLITTVSVDSHTVDSWTGYVNSLK